MTVRIAMWSGPRSLSTAMMRAWENREDTAVVDEPLYACYLAETGIEHPMKEEVLASQSADWQEVVAALGGPIPNDAEIYFQKHMAHHLLPSMGRAWLDDHHHCFLVRDPRAILASYAQKRDSVTLADIGITQLGELFDRVADQRGVAPPVVVTNDVQRDPRGTLTRLCAALGVAFSPRMLSWAPGRRDTDGVWGAHWYENVERSTGFSAPRSGSVALSPPLEACAEKAQPFYEKLLTGRV
jgi:hypothetical protein